MWPDSTAYRLHPAPAGAAALPAPARLLLTSRMAPTSTPASRRRVWETGDAIRAAGRWRAAQRGEWPPHPEARRLLWRSMSS